MTTFKHSEIIQMIFSQTVKTSECKTFFYMKKKYRLKRATNGKSYFLAFTSIKLINIVTNFSSANDNNIEILYKQRYFIIFRN